MRIKIEYSEGLLEGKVSVIENYEAHTWNRVRDAILHIQPDAYLAADAITCDWSSVLSAVSFIAELRETDGLVVEFNPEAVGRIKQYRDEFRVARSASDTLRVSLTPAEVTSRLVAAGYTKRSLRSYQMRDAVRLASLPHGANFSVPGAGKTSVALAIHLLTKAKDTYLLVVAPKNAFPAWDEVIPECLDLKNPNADTTGFIRLVGGTENIEHLLENSPSRMIISYDQLIRSTEVISRLLRTKKVHMILDESHRMKAGDKSQRGSTLLALSHLAARRDILSGTPIPRALEDIKPQIDFLWPGQGIGLRAVTAGTPHTVLQNFYVRTTKHELDLPPKFLHFPRVEMSEPQLALYGLLRQEILKRLAGIRFNSNIDLASAKRSVMRLLQASSNPILVVRALTNGDPEGFSPDDPKIRAIFEAIVEERDSPKIRQVCELARQLAAQGQRSVIWANFRENVERIAELLSDVGSTFIHGSVGAGSSSDPNTREGRVKRFHDEDNECMVLVANPAACSEGISLHRVCHNALYLERTFNAAHYLQSVDRIHRLGLSPDQETNVYIFESVAPNVTGAIDYSVRRRLIDKLRIMSSALNDTDLQQLALDEEDADVPFDYDITLDDLRDIIDELSGQAQMPGEEED